MQDRGYLGDDYKRAVLEHMSIEQLTDTLMINPTVHLSPSYRDTGLSASYTFQPLSNLVYTRDQQITGCKGIVMCRLRSQQRQLESDLMRFCFAKLGTIPPFAVHWAPPLLSNPRARSPEIVLQLVLSSAHMPTSKQASCSVPSAATRPHWGAPTPSAPEIVPQLVLTSTHFLAPKQ